MRKVAIYGGSFNPIHKGHLAVAQSVIAQGLSDEVWLMVSPQNPLKPAHDLLPEQDRMALARLATTGLQGIKASDFEFSLPRPSFTWVTLKALSEAYTTTHFTLLIGGDNWTVFDRWAHHEELLHQYGVIIYPRPEYPINAAELPHGACLLEAPLFPVSSTEIRQALRKGESVSAWLPDDVEQAIRQQHFFL